MTALFSVRANAGSNISDLGFQITEGNLHIRLEQLRTRMLMYPSLILSQMVLQPLFVWMLWEHASHQLMLLWLALFYALHMVEFMHWYQYKNNLNTLRQCREWHLFFTSAAFAAGLLWGGVAFAFFPVEISEQSLLICVLLGLTAGAVTMNPVHPPSLYSYVFGIMALLITKLLIVGDIHQTILALMLLLFTVLVLLAGRGLNKTFVLSLQQRFENRELLKKLFVQQAATEEARNQLEKANAELRENESKLEQMVHERTSQLLQRSEEISLIKDATILALSSLAETRDNETGNHIRRTQRYIRILAAALQGNPRFSDFLSDENIELLHKLAPLHDVGKVGIPDRILHKPGKLTAEEFEIMKTHTILGGNAIAAAESEVNIQSHFLRIARQIAVGHHEKWDGSGYPFGLSGDDIPIPARLMALADVYDALTCDRVYKSAMGHDEVEQIIVEGRGKHFDPDVVDAFLAIKEEFILIAGALRDEVRAAVSLQMAT